MKESKSGKYDNIKIKVLNWVKLEQTPDGAWITIWDIVLQQPITETINLKQISKALSYEDYHVWIDASQGTQLKVSVITQRWAGENEVFFAIRTLFDKIEQHLGEIKTIQGQERDIWKMSDTRDSLS